GAKLRIRAQYSSTALHRPARRSCALFSSRSGHTTYAPDGPSGQCYTKAGAQKRTRFSDPRVEQLIAEGRVPDPKVRQQKYAEIERILWDEEPEIWPYYSVAIYAISDKLSNFEARRDYERLLHEE